MENKSGYPHPDPPPSYGFQQPPQQMYSPQQPMYQQVLTSQPAVNGSF